jgi:ribosome maturation protein Sdo1
MYSDDDKAAETKAESKDISKNDMLIFKAHEAVDVFKKVLKDCYVNTTDDSHEECYQEAISELADSVKNNLPDLPKKKETPEERIFRKMNES